MRAHKSPILHGLCTYGYATRVIIEELCPIEDLTEFTSRFSKEVYPGDTITIKIMNTNMEKTYRLQVEVKNRTVLSHGIIVRK